MINERRALLIEVAKRRLRLGRKHLAEDLVQDAIAVTLASRDVRDPVAFALDVIGKLARNENKRHTELPLYAAMDMPDESFDVETAVDIETTILRLFGPGLGEIVWLHFAHGFSLSEISKKYGKSKTYWQGVLGGARIMLAFALKEYGTKQGGQDTYRYGGKSAKVLSTRKI